LNIAFINPSLRPDSQRRQLPVGLAYIMTAVKKAGFNFSLIDMDINQIAVKDLYGLLSSKTYNVYALGCIVTGFKRVKKIAQIIRNIHPTAIIIAGNSVATSIPEILLRNTEVDIAVLGEGDITIVELLKALDQHNSMVDVQGIAFKKDGEYIFTEKRGIISCLDDVAFPDWDIFELNKYQTYASVNVNSFSAQNVLSFPLNSARGCPFNCTFCYHVFKGEKYRRYSEPMIISEIIRLKENYGCDFVSFWDELTFPNIRSVEARIKSLGALDFRVGWDAPTRGNLFRKQHVEFVRELKSVGCDNLAFSLENASSVILQAMNKKMNVAQFIEQAQTLWKGGVIPLTSLVFGYPQETPETIRLTLDVCRECNIFPSVGFLLPLPGTSIYDWAVKNGFIVNEVEYLERIGDRQDFHINLTNMSDREFVDTVTEGLNDLAEKLGIKVDSAFKTVTYQSPKAPI
jgi:anaerobic magnesium-protoporphyrin IX monomethyl ester cyclase